MHDFPWLTALTAWAATLGLSFWLGRLSEIHKEFVMVVRQTVRAWFDRWFLVLYAAIGFVALAGVILGGTASVQNGRDLVTSCENANESRAASRALWGYILDVSTSNNPHPTKQQRAFYDDFRAYINKVYVQHDCSDLSKKYPLPEPPRVIDTKRNSDDT